MYSEGVGKPNEVREWTLMFYFASDNPLSPSVVSQLKAIKDAGFHLDANVIARFDPHTVETPTHVFDVNLISKLELIRKLENNDNKGPRSDVGFTANDPFVRTLVPDKLWGDEFSALEHDSATPTVRDILVSRFTAKGIRYDPPKPPKFSPTPGIGATASDRLTDEPGPTESLENFLEFCRKFYPARHYALFILGHGIVVGNDIFLFDEHSMGNHAVTLKDLGDTLTDFANAIQGPEAREKGQEGEFELLAFHSCSMSGVEVAYELKGSAKYMLASQGPAFVGSWPYRQILIRIFNDINRSVLARADIKDRRGLAQRILAGADAPCAALKGLLTTETTDLFQQISDTADAPLDQVEDLVKQLNSFLESPDLFKAFAAIPLRPETAQKVANHKTDPFKDEKLHRLNRQLLFEALADELDMVRGMASRIFDYVLFNSYDFQLAGYSFDLCLTDLRKLNEKHEDGLKSALEGLAETLCEALPAPPNVPARVYLPRTSLVPLNDHEKLALELIVLAHWEAQSYYEENYTDIFDFCFCLQRRCLDMAPLLSEGAANKLLLLGAACEKVMRKFDIGKESLIVRTEFAGPSYQYSHGLSIFFPWSTPVASDMWTNQYNQYNLMQDSTHSWKKFLDTYLQASLRATQEEENSIAHMPPRPSNPDADLLEEMSRLVFNEFGQLKDDPRDKTDKDHKNDPTGDDCVCPSIKNYPPFTRGRSVPTSRRFFQRMRITKE